MLLVDYRAGVACSEESLQALIPGVVRDIGQCKCVSLCQESHLIRCFVSLKVLRVQQLDFRSENRSTHEVDDCLYRDFGLGFLLFCDGVRKLVDLNDQEALCTTTL